jgi:DNA end-binding protein Ku
MAPALIGQALALVEAMTGKYDPAAHSDRYAEALTALIEAKLAGTPQPAPAPGTEATAALDLTDMLAASVTAAKAARAETKEAAA